MSIAPMRRVAIVGRQKDKARVMSALQTLGCVQLDAEIAPGPGSPQARRALAFLLRARPQRHPAAAGSHFDAQAVVDEVVAIDARLQAIDEERRALERRIGGLAAWGDYRLDPELPAHGVRLWCYAMPLHRLAEMPTDLTWQVVGRDHRHVYLVVLHPDEPRLMSVARTHTGSLGLSVLLERRQELEVEADDLEAARSALTRWRDALARELARLDDNFALEQALARAPGDESLFTLWGWSPAAAIPVLSENAQRFGFAMVERVPATHESPPTMLLNEGAGLAGARLLRTFLVPAYRSWDPSAWLFWSFVAFFGLVVADIGYAGIAAAAAALVLARRRLDPVYRWWIWSLCSSTALWGLLTGTVFGNTVPKGSMLGRFALLEGADVERLMLVAMAVGIVHLVLACLSQAARGGRDAATAAGWALVFAGAAAWGAVRVALAPPAIAMPALCVAGLGLLVALAATASTRSGFAARAAATLAALMRLPAALGDVLSYLRLFALSYAGLALAGAFNSLAAEMALLPGFGLMLAGALLLLGHGLNLVLGIAGGFVHGLRLNLIEFIAWAGVDEGHAFHPFSLSAPPANRPMSWTRPSFS